MEQAIRAILLLGPTGSGKSPVGMLLEGRGGFRHFDFGAELRAAAAGERGLPPDLVAYIRGLLATHALLPGERFDIADRLLEAFLARSGFDPERDWLVLNGLPRHVGQARALAARVQVEHVVALECEAAAIRARVARRRRGEGRDHAGRDDDGPDAIACKVAVYASETEPLIAHYAAQPGVRIIRLHVEADTGDATLAEQIAAWLAPPTGRRRSKGPPSSARPPGGSPSPRR